MAAEEQPDTAYRINDPEELSQTKRINELLSRRKDVIDARDEAFDVAMLGQASEQEALAYYRSRIESLILDLWTKFQNEEMDEGQQFLGQEKIDTVYVPPPPDLSDMELAPGVEVPSAKPVHIRGLKWFIENGQTIQQSFSVQLWDPPGQHTMTNEILVPRETLDKALTKCIEFMDEAGIDAELTEEDQGDAEFDYSDLLEEGPPGVDKKEGGET